MLLIYASPSQRQTWDFRPHNSTTSDHCVSWLRVIHNCSYNNAITNRISSFKGNLEFCSLNQFFRGLAIVPKLCKVQFLFHTTRGKHLLQLDPTSKSSQQMNPREPFQNSNQISLFPPSLFLANIPAFKNTPVNTPVLGFSC